MTLFKKIKGFFSYALIKLGGIDGGNIDFCKGFLVVIFLFHPQTLHDTYLLEINDMGYSFVNPPAEGE